MMTKRIQLSVRSLVLTLGLLLLMVSLATGYVLENDIKDECLPAGGMCVRESECPSEKRDETLRCSGQGGNEKAVCCYGFPTSHSCGSLGGECTTSSTCGRAPRQNDVYDCPQNKPVCCIFIH